jgi:hypothetical protein
MIRLKTNGLLVHDSSRRIKNMHRHSCRDSLIGNSINFKRVLK